MKLVIDSNVVVWLLLGDRGAIPSHAVDALTDPGSDVFVSAASVWEIAVKRSIGKLAVGSNWFEVLSKLDFAHLPITAAHAREVEVLPWHHKDPFDRLLVAQCIVENATLVTSDRTLDLYEIETLWTNG